MAVPTTTTNTATQSPTQHRTGDGDVTSLIRRSLNNISFSNDGSKTPSRSPSRSPSHKHQLQQKHKQTFSPNNSLIISNRNHCKGKKSPEETFV